MTPNKSVFVQFPQNYNRLPFLVGISENELTCAVLQPQRNFDNVWRNGQVSFAFSHENHVNFQNTKKAQNDQGAFWAARF